MIFDTRYPIFDIRSFYYASKALPVIPSDPDPEHSGGGGGTPQRIAVL